MLTTISDLILTSMVEGTESTAAKEMRSLASRGDLSGASEHQSLLSRDYTELQPRTYPPAQREPATRALSREIQEHKRQLEDQTYLDQAVSFISRPIHKSTESLARMEQLAEETRGAQPSPEKEREIRRAIAADRSAMNWQSEITTYGGGMVQTAGLFLSGKKGIALTALSWAAGSAKQSDSGVNQFVDATTGAGKGLLMRGAFKMIGQSSMEVPGRAFWMGTSSRAIDSTLSRKTYLNESGEVDVLGGIGKIAVATGHPVSIGTDLLVFGAGELAMRNSAMKNLMTKDRFTRTLSAVGATGFAAGSAEEIKHQWTDGQFDPLKIAARGLARGGTDMIAAIPGARQARFAQQRETTKQLATADNVVAERIKNQGRQGVSTETTAERPRFQSLTSRISGQMGSFTRVMPGSTAREFQIVGGDVAALEALGKSRNANAVMQVREVTPTGELGPQKSMLVQHVDNGIPLSSRLASTVDLIASCNPRTILGQFRSKHLFPDANGSVFLSAIRGNGSARMAIGVDPLRVSAATGGGGTIELGRTRTVSELFELPDTSNFMRTPRALEHYARAMRHFKEPAIRVLDGGADSIAIEMADQSILKITDRPYRKSGVPLWRDEWGSRTYKTENGVYRMDARILTDPFQIEINHEPALYYKQERGRTPVSLQSLRTFKYNVESGGQYVFWDGNASSFGQTQLGYVPLNAAKSKWGVVLLDYDAVRKPGDAPPPETQSSSGNGHWMNRYRGDNVEWESPPPRRK